MLEGKFIHTLVNSISLVKVFGDTQAVRPPSLHSIKRQIQSNLHNLSSNNLPMIITNAADPNAIAMVTGVPRPFVSSF